MKKFFAERQLTPFDFVTLYYICRASEVYSLWWFLLIIPQMIISIFFEQHYLKKDEPEKNTDEEE